MTMRSNTVVKVDEAMMGDASVARIIQLLSCKNDDDVEEPSSSSSSQKVETGDVVAVLEAMETGETHHIRATASGRILQWMVEMEDSVTVGDPICTIDTTSITTSNTDVTTAAEDDKDSDY